MRKARQQRLRRLSDGRVAPELDRACDDLRRVVRRVAWRLRTLDERGDEPATAEGRSVEPARIVPAADVRWIEELLPGHRAERPPDRVRDVLAAHPQQAGVEHDGRLDHSWATVEVGM